MWCSRCKNKFCQLCMKPVTFIPMHMHLAFGQCQGKPSFIDDSFSYILSLIFLICVFLLKNHFQSYWYILTLPLMYYCLHMFFDWSESLNDLNDVIRIFISMLMGITMGLVIINIFIIGLGLQMTVRVKSTVEISQDFVAFLESMNFT